MHKKNYVLLSGEKELKAGLKDHSILWLWEEITERNENTLKAIFAEVAAGRTFYQETQNNLIIVSRSTRNNVLIQVSYLWKTEAGIIPASHKDINTEKEFIFEEPFYISHKIQEV